MSSKIAYYLGIDIGSRTSKGIVIRNNDVIARNLLLSGVNYRQAVYRLREGLLEKAGISPGDITFVVATGQGAANVDYADTSIADIRCCARGMNHVLPEVRTVIDVERQLTQVLRVSEEGQVINFFTSERCASGAGWFLEIISNVLQIPLEEIGPLSLKSDKPVTFTTGCAVFGESEAVSRVAEGISKENILAGVHKALAEKIISMVDRVGREPEYGICGGGALNAGLVEWVKRRLGAEILVPPQPHFITALGAAIFARELGKIRNSR